MRINLDLRNNTPLLTVHLCLKELLNVIDVKAATYLLVLLVFKARSHTARRRTTSSVVVRRRTTTDDDAVIEHVV